MIEQPPTPPLPSRPPAAPAWVAHAVPRPADRRRGTTLVELLLVLAVGAVLLGLGVPRGRALLDHLAVTAAREEIAGMLHRARALAHEASGATLLVDVDAESMTLVGGDGGVRGRLLLAERGLDLSTSGSGGVIDMTWNALGWGVITSRTLVVRRGAGEARVVVSSRGRATRR